MTFILFLCLQFGIGPGGYMSSLPLLEFGEMAWRLRAGIIWRLPQLLLFAWWWLSAEMVTRILTHRFFICVLSFLKLWWFCSKDKHPRRTKVVSCLWCSLKSQCHFSMATGFPRLKERRHRPLHISVDRCQHHTVTRAWRMVHTLWSPSGNAFSYIPKCNDEER